MGTNYYLHTSLGPGPHIGKTYSLPKDNGYVWQYAIEPDTLRKLKQYDFIEDEYGTICTQQQIADIIDEASEISLALIGQEFS